MIKDVTVHLDGSERDETRIRHAEAIAAGFGAHVTGLYTNRLVDIAFALSPEAGAAAAQVLAELQDDERRQGDAVVQRLAERFSRLAPHGDIRRLDETAAELPDRAASEARWSDLFVTSRPEGGNGSASWRALFEAVLFEGGRGLYVVPDDRAPCPPIERVLIAWRDTRETARAVAEAMPFIAKARRVTVLLVDAEHGNQSGLAPAADIARHLGRHGAPVEVVAVDSDGRPVSDIIREQARRLAANLIVMGGYGHSRTREWVFGGTTREMLEDTPAPLLIAH